MVLPGPWQQKLQQPGQRSGGNHEGNTVDRGERICGCGGEDSGSGSCLGSVPLSRRGGCGCGAVAGDGARHGGGGGVYAFACLKQLYGERSLGLFRRYPPPSGRRFVPPAFVSSALPRCMLTRRLVQVCRV